MVEREKKKTREREKAREKKKKKKRCSRFSMRVCAHADNVCVCRKLH
jgi:hypothetical protein